LDRKKGADDDSTAGFGIGSRWYNSATAVEWICMDATPGDAEWAAVASGSLADYLPLTGGTMTGALSMGGNPLNMKAGGGSGGGTLNMDGGTLNMSNGGGSGGTTLNMDSGTLQGPLSFFGATAVGQQSSSGNTSTPIPGSSSPVLVDTTFDGSVGSTAYTIGDIVAALKEYGPLVS